MKGELSGSGRGVVRFQDSAVEQSKRTFCSVTLAGEARIRSWNSCGCRSGRRGWLNGAFSDFEGWSNSNVMKFPGKALGRACVGSVPEFCSIMGLPAGIKRGREIPKYSHYVGTIVM